MRPWSVLVGVAVAGCSNVLGLDGLVYEETSSAASTAGAGATGGAATGGAAGSGGAGGSTSGGSSSTGGSQVASYFDEVMADAPIAYWRLDGALQMDATADAAGSHHGTCVGSCSFDVPGALKSDPGNTAVAFGARDSRIEISDTDVFAFDKPAQFTIELWARHEARPPDGVEFLLSRRSTASDEAGYALYNEQGATPSHGGRLYGPSGSVVASALANLMIPSDAFVHMVVTYKSNFILYYRNGELEVNNGELASGQEYLPDDPTILTIGGSSGDDEFAGTIDEVAIYGTALSYERIRAHYLAAGYSLP